MNPHRAGAHQDEAARAQRLRRAEERAAALFDAVEQAGIIRPGVSDRAASAEIVELAAERFGVERHWHKRIVRSGPHTLQPYHENPPDRVIEHDDIVFADFGPVFEGWEADFGRTWVLGEDPHKHQLRDDLQPVFDAGRRHLAERPELTAAELYHHVVGLAEARGWQFGNHHCGHLVGEFPHQNFDGPRSDSLITASNTAPLRRPDPSGRTAHWILEVHLVDPNRRIGGFFEQLLTL